mmetsp:Transcript_14472/g.35278  ORF Transcript_14472/g.35278 Transcript_14472/m.35278 type:complete len:246 (+) Transcript_14472:155-892(+)
MELLRRRSNVKALLSQTLILQHDRVLLGTWKPGAGELEGRKTGLLGQVREKEDPTDACRRITFELAGMEIPAKLIDRRAVFIMTDTVEDENGKPCGTIDYEEQEMVYEATAYEELVPKETELFIPEWIPLDSIPYDEMPQDDREWYPAVLSGNCMRGYFEFEGVDMKLCNVWEVPRIVEDLPANDFHALTVDELKHLAKCCGAKEPGLGWHASAPPRARKNDLIRLLGAYDRAHQKWRDKWFHGI